MASMLSLFDVIRSLISNDTASGHSALQSLATIANSLHEKRQAAAISGDEKQLTHTLNPGTPLNHDEQQALAEVLSTLQRQDESEQEPLAAGQVAIPPEGGWPLDVELPKTEVSAPADTVVLPAEDEPAPDLMQPVAHEQTPDIVPTGESPR